MYIYSQLIIVYIWTSLVVFFLSLFLYHNQWEYDDSTEHVSN